MKNKAEKRFYDGEIQQFHHEEDGPMIVEGYALKFNTVSNSMGNWRETIDKDALKNTKLDNIVCLDNHDKQKVLGRNTAGTLEIIVDDEGLRFKCTFPDTTYARDLYKAIERKDVNKMSFGMFVADDGDVYTKTGEDEYLRTVYDIEEIYEVSICTIPAYDDTSVSIAQRSFEDMQKNEEKEAFLLLLELENY